MDSSTRRPGICLVDFGDGRLEDWDLLLPGRVEPPADDLPLYQVGQKNIALHWVSLSGPKETESEAGQIIAKCFAGKVQERGQKDFYDRLQVWDSGARLQTGHNVSRGWLAVFSGGVCDQLAGPDLWSLVRSMMTLGACVTRVDVRADFTFDAPSELIRTSLASCEAGELCRVKGFRPEFDGDAKSGQTQLNGVYFGARSKGGHRFVRFYDKGIESGMAPRGHHLRYEAEFTGDHGRMAGAYIFGASSYDLGMQAGAALLAGVVDFRECGKVTNLTRRKRVAWFNQLFEGIVSMRPRVAAEPSTWQSKASWLRDQVGPTLAAIAQQAGMTVGDVASWLLQGVQPGDKALHDAATYELAAFIRSGEPVAEFLVDPVHQSDTMEQP